MDATNIRKRINEGDREPRKKRRKLMKDVRAFLDIEASDSESEEEEMEMGQGFIQDDAYLEGDQKEDWEDESNEDEVDGEIEGQGVANYDSYLRDARSEAWEEESSEDDDNEVEGDPENTRNVEGMGRASQLTTSGRENEPRVDDRLAAMIKKYQAFWESRDNQLPTQVDADDHDEVDALADRLMRMPNADDPGLWRVRVWDDAEEESFFLLNDRLKVRSHLAISVFLPPCVKGWICVESASRENVEELCINLSTFRHPLEIFFVPVNERMEWIERNHPTPPVKEGSWVRLKKKSKLEKLWETEGTIDDRVCRYGKDLAHVGRNVKGRLSIFIVPRLLPPLNENQKVEETEEEKKERRRRRVRVPLLLHPMALGVQKEAVDKRHELDPEMWWVPKKAYEFVEVQDGIGLLAHSKSKKELRGSDVYMPPFAYYGVPKEAVETVGVVPTVEELKLFAEGIRVGQEELDFPLVPPAIIPWTYENHIAAPLEIGQKVEARFEMRLIQGVLEDLRFERAVVRVKGTEDDVEVDVKRVRRYYEVGDRVQVIKGSHSEREGWVVNRSGDCGECLNLFNHKENENFDVKSWHVIPHEALEWDTAQKIEVGDMVRVINPLAAQYKKMGRVCKVNTAFVEVTDSTNITFIVPPWFLEVEDAAHEDGIRKARFEKTYDRYKELVNTWVVVSGNHPEKGLYGRIREHLGNQIMSVEASSGSRVLKIHVDFLLTSGGGRDLREYHVGRHTIRSGVGYTVPNFIRVPEQAERASTPVPDEPLVDEDAAGPTRLPDERLVDEDAAGAKNQSALVDNITTVLPTLELHVPMITYRNQVLPADWLMKNNLVKKRIYAYIRNSEPDAFGRGGLEKGVFEGDRVLVLSGERADAIQVHVRKRTLYVPGWFLFPEMPTSKGQDVVVISGDMVGNVYLTRKQKEDGSFPLGRRNYSGKALCYVEREKLARCDPK